jgi:Fic family protein
MKPSKPAVLPVKLDYSVFAKEWAEASFALGRLDESQKKLPNPNLLVAPMVTKEATISSKIEGTRSTLSDVMLFEAGEEAKYSDTQEVVNYRRATFWAIDALNKRDFNLPLIKELHNMLLRGVRGEKYNCGKFRNNQVWIGKKGERIDKATYVPVDPLLVLDYMENLENYLLNNVENPLLKAGIIHYQFEAIHPFSDGNGRIGRLIIPLFLHKNGMLFQPILYLSGYFEEHRSEYIEALHDVDVTQKYENWLKLFLGAVKEQAGETQRTIDDIMLLRREIEIKTELIKSPYMGKVLDFIFNMPIFSTSDITKSLGFGRATALRLIKNLEELNIIIQYKDAVSKKKKVFLFPRLINKL